MAQKLYPRSVAIDGASIYSDTHRAEGASMTNAGVDGVTAEQLKTAVGTASRSNSDFTAAGPAEFFLGAFLSVPLSADFTISGTITFNIWGSETSNMANCGFKVYVYRYDSNLVRTLIVASARGVEMATSNAVNNWTAAPTSTACKKGDRIQIYFSVVDAGGTMASGFTATQRFNGPTGGADGDTWVQFTEDLTFQTTDPAGSTLYLTSTASAVNPNSITANEAWTSRGGGVTNAAKIFSTTSKVQLTDTSAGTGTNIEWFSKPLTALTLDGMLKGNIRALVNAVAQGDSIWLEVAVCDNDGTLISVIADACMSPRNSTFDANYGSSSGEPRTTETAYPVYPAPITQSITNGQRLRFRFYVVNSGSAVINGNGTTSLLSIPYNGTSGGASGDTFIILPQSVTEYVASGGAPIAGFFDRRTPRRRIMQRI